jgi:undecaprenyl-diphosphatase
MELWQALVLGLVEGITEYLPVSSTGHLIVASALLGVRGEKEALDAFEVVIQGGAILAVVGLYWGRFVQMLRGVLGRDAAGLRLLVNLVIAFVPAAVVGLALHKVIKERLFYPGPVAAALIVGGLFMMWIDRWKRGRAEGKGIDELTAREALVIGVCQIASMWPGTSRSMMTIAGGYFAGLRTAAAAEFSFLLGVPTLLAAAGLDLAKDLKHAHDTGGPTMFRALGVPAAVLGMAVAAVSATAAVRWLVGFLTRRGLTPFAWYRIGFGVVLLVLVWQGMVVIEPEPGAKGTAALAPPDSRAVASVESRADTHP